LDPFVFRHGQMLITGKENWRRHRVWAWFTLLTTLGLVVGYLLRSRGAETWPGGSSDIGLVYGVLGGLIILFELALWPRRWPGVRAWRILGRTQVWMRAHLWLGLLTIPLLWLHSGFTWGGGLSTTLSLLLIAVLGSGIFGLVVQQVIPRLMLSDLPGETIFSQIDVVAAQDLRDADLLVESLCGAVGVATPEAELVDFAPAGQGRRVIGELAVEVCSVVDLPRDQQSLLRQSYLRTIRPYLEEAPTRVRGGGVSILQSATRANEFFSELSGRLEGGSSNSLRTLESLVRNRRSMHRQVRLHRWLHLWLGIHLPLSIALVLLMFLHVFVSLKYW
jgi:hypothetical protein